MHEVSILSDLSVHSDVVAGVELSPPGGVHASRPPLGPVRRRCSRRRRGWAEAQSVNACGLQRVAGLMGHDAELLDRLSRQTYATTLRMVVKGLAVTGPRQSLAVNFECTRRASH